LRRIYVLNNGNKVDDIPRSAHSDHHPAGRIQLPAATAIAAIMLLPSFAMLLVVNMVQSWSPNAMADVTIVQKRHRRPASSRSARYLLMAVAFWWPERHWPPEARPPCPPLR
jgi:hypothetical protein